MTASTPPGPDRRAFLGLAAGALTAAAGAAQDRPAAKKKPTQFQVACMTLPYSRFPLERALKGIRSAGYRYVAWGTTHQEGGKRVPVLPGDAPPGRAKELAKRCRDLGLEPVMLFGPPPEKVEAFRACIRQAAAGGVSQVLTMGSTRGNDRKLWVKNFKALGPAARDAGVLIAVKQHGGNTGTGAALA